MNLKIYLPFALLIFGLAACKNNNSVDPEFNYDAMLTKQSTSTLKEISKITFPGIKTEEKNQTTVVSTSANSNSNDANIILNPAHGQPGHRCEIAVGAPLNNTPVSITNQNQANAIVASAKSNANNTDKILNPAHGQPGHRCDIAVGASLNNIPATLSQQKQPVTIKPKTKVITAPGMNPPHGEPGHRCDIGVGTPLSRATAKKDSAGRDAKSISTTVVDSTKN